ncbi:unnamed protein product [Bursaphelenchus xylophilus]|uniref:(pine wood nematode) hypothetical protein n=1 Tax=Bursaphelenchus xylophilus TaxID=6326 RepID=A0A1I7SMK5_BURXY|nr:unnamed protein product [Bursaphelenchus xylophilus]CAG9130264.1 unnamed protein product [Bursaphelenchus xylophilus]
MENYCDGWDEFRRALTITRKSFLKKLNPRNGLPILKELSVKMIDQSQFELASLCYMEMSVIYNDLGDILHEKEALFEASRLISLGYSNSNQGFIRIEPFLLHRLEEVYVKIAELSLRAKFIQTIGVILLELACKFMDIDCYDISFEYLIRVLKYLKSDFYYRKLIFDKVIICLDNSKSLASDLSDFSSIFLSYIKTENLNGILKEKMVEIELKLVLLHLKQYSEDWEMRSRSVLSNYLNSEGHKTLMNKADLILVTSLINSYQKRDFVKLIFIFHSQFWHKLDDYGRRLMANVIERTRPSAGVLHEELEVVLKSDMTGLERRKKMIEWYKTVKVKNITTYQTL